MVNGHYLNSICSGVGFFLSVTNKTEDKGPRAQVFVTARAKWTDDHYAYTSDTVPDIYLLYCSRLNGSSAKKRQCFCRVTVNFW